MEATLSLSDKTTGELAGAAIRERRIGNHPFPST
jgi:hypothetical protein